MRNPMKERKSTSRYFALLGVSAFILMASGACTNYAVLSEIADSRLTLILKGTYESNNGYGLQNLYNDDGLTTEAAALPATDLAGFANTAPTSETELNWYLDIAEIRAAVGGGLASGSDPEDYYNYFARSRQLLCSEEYSYEGKELKNCRAQNGSAKLAAFLNDGFIYPSTDLKVQRYNHLAIYMRRIVIDPARFYDGTGAALSSSEGTAQFDNRKIKGTEISSLMQLAPGDNADTQAPRLFPLERTDLDLPVPDNEKPYVMEVRIFMKNLMMKHVTSISTSLYNGGKLYSAFVAPSDWAANHPYSDSTLAGRLGGNTTFTARIYDPDNVRMLTVSSDSGTSGSTLYYYAVVPAGETFDPKAELPLAATQGTLPANIKNLPPASYDLYKTCDLKYQTSSGETATANADGYPETAVKCATVDLTGGDQSVSLTGCNC